MNDRKFVGRGKEFGQYGNIKIGLKMSDLVANDKGYVNLVIGKKRETDQYGNTHSVWVDDFVPTKQNRAPEPPVPPLNCFTNDSGEPLSDDLPF